MGRGEEGEHEITDDKKRVEGRRETKEWICTEGGKGRKKRGKVPKGVGKGEESPKIDRKCTKYEIACRGGGVTLQQEKIITAMT